VLSAIDEILWLLKDGKWHNLREIIEKCSTSKSKAKMVVSFLWEYDFIQVNENGRKAKLCPLMLNFIYEIQRVEKEEALSHKGFEGAVGVKEFESLRRSFKRV
jgi:predicted transcriptional regulator